MSSFANLVTKFWQMTLSNAQPLWLLVTSCLIAVKNPCGLKNPVTQNTWLINKILLNYSLNETFYNQRTLNRKCLYYLSSTMETPSPKLTVSFQQLSKPEPNSCWLPRQFFPRRRYSRIIHCIQNVP